MIGNRHGYGAEIRSSLHDEVASTLTNNLKTVLFEDATRVSSGQDTQFTHGPLRSA
jgi:hypothetical protein